MAPERITADAAALILGVPVRTVQALAARGDVPAAKIGRNWTFDEQMLRRWIRVREAETCQRANARTYTSAAKRGGRDARSPVKSTEAAYELAMKGLLAFGRRSGAKG